MANLKVKVPIEIEDYKERIILGLSLRQLAWGSLSLICGAVTFLLLKNINNDLATYATMLAAVPGFCMGFIKSREGYTFEYLVGIRLRAIFGKNKRPYETEVSNNPVPEEIVELMELHQEINVAQIEQNKGDVKKVVKKKKRKRKADSREREYDVPFPVQSTAKSYKRARKKTFSYIKEAGGGGSQTECQAKETAC